MFIMRAKFRPVFYDHVNNNLSTATKKFNYLIDNKRVALCITALVILSILYLFVILNTVTYEGFGSFTYPLEIPNFENLITSIDDYRAKRNIKKVGYEEFYKILDAVQVNKSLDSNLVPFRQFKELNFDIDLDLDCQSYWIDLGSQLDSSLRVMIIVKTAVNYHAKRNAIRATWALNRRIGRYLFRTVFMVGGCHISNPVPKELRRKLNGTIWTPEMCGDYIRQESLNHKDLIQSSGIDTYYNNSIKTIMTHRWITERCPSDFLLAIDDDYALEVDNLIKFIDDLAGRYNSSLATPSRSASVSADPDKEKSLKLKQISRDHYVYAGFLRNNSKPHRRVSSKYYISREDYPFEKYPPFVTGGFIFMSKKLSRRLYLSSFLVRCFIFDDVYLAIIAHKLDVQATHEPMTMCTGDYYVSSKPYKPNSTTCIGAHEVSPEDLIRVWELKAR